MSSLHVFNYGPPQDYDDYPDQNPFAPPDHHGEESGGPYG